MPYTWAAPRALAASYTPARLGFITAGRPPDSAAPTAVASGPDENGESVVEAAEGEVEDTDAKQAIAESAAASGAGESTLPVAGPAPISHAEGKVPVSKRPKSEELKTPWADGRTFPGTGKNAPCPCGSGRKYKMCHGQNEK